MQHSDLSNRPSGQLWALLPKVLRVALVLVPLLGLGYFGLNMVQERLTLVDDMQALIRDTSFAVSLSTLVHELQRERGLSSALALGAGSAFDSRLRDQWVQTNARLNQVRQDGQAFQEAGGALDLGQLSRLPDELERLRSQVIGQDISAEDAIAAYSAINELLLDTIVQLTRHGGGTRLGQELLTYTLFLQIKEQAGLERAETLRLLANRDQALWAWQRSIAGQSIQTARFLDLATPEQRQLARRLEEPPPDDLLAVRQSIQQGAGELPGPARWFEMSTAWINELEQTQLVLSRALLGSAEDIGRTAHRGGAFALALVVIALLLVGLSALLDMYRRRGLVDALRRQRDEAERLALVARHTSKMAVIADSDGRIQWVNAGFERMTGYSLEEVRGEKPGRLLGGPDKDADTRMKFRDAVAAGRDLDAEVLNYDRNGQPYWVLIELRALRDASGALTGFIALETDITERKSLEASLQQANVELDKTMAYLARAQTVANAGSWSLDLRQNTLWWSDQTRQIFGQPDLAEPTFEDFLSFVHPEDRELIQTAWAAALRGEPYDLEHRALIKGQLRYLREVAEVEFDVQGQPVAAIGVVQDITVRRQLERQLVESQKMEAIGKLTGGIAHDFNNLLQVILGRAEGLQDDLAEQPHMQNTASQIRTAAERAAELTSQLLAFSRRQMLRSELLDLGGVAAQLLPLIDQLVGSQIRVKLRAPGAPVVVLADRSQLESALMNLVMNAQQAMKGEGTLTISVDSAVLDAAAGRLKEVPAGTYGRLTVSDTGPGMPPDIAEKAFEPFYTTKPVGKGTGLGLSMVWGFARQSGGHAEIQSTPGQGAAIVLWLPVHHGAGGSVPAQLKPNGASAGG